MALDMCDVGPLFQRRLLHNLRKETAMTRLLAALFAVLVPLNAYDIYAAATRHLPGPDVPPEATSAAPVLPADGQGPQARELIWVVVP